MKDRVNILVVDDRDAQRFTIESALSGLGENIVCVASGREALKFLLDHDAAVILLDVNMPVMDGFETASLIRGRQRTTDTPIIFLTADTDELLAARGYALGAVDYLFCPFPPEVLRAKVKVFVTLSRMRERVRREAQQQIELTREQAARASAEEQSRRLHVLVQAGGVLAASLDGSGFGGAMVDLLVPTLADETGLVLREQTGLAATTVWRDARGVSNDVPEPFASAAERVAERGATETLRTTDQGEPTALVLPLVAHGECYGALCMAMQHSGRHYVHDDREIIDLVCGRIAAALESRRLYRELQQRDRRKDEFLAMLSHELRNPLSAISTASGLLAMPVVTDAAAASARQIIARQTSNLARIVDDLLEVSRVTAGRIAVNRAPMDLMDAVGRALDALSASGQLDRHELDVSGEHVAIVDADLGRMEQVVMNLIVNAVKYTDPGGRITIRVGLDGADAFVKVSDTGIGIGPELLPHLFDIFVQGSQSLDRSRGGLGIGLTLARKLVELQGGTIEAHSPGPGCGSTFVVHLPAVAPASAGGAPGETSDVPVPPLRVLVVEDNTDAREMLRHLLELSGHEVHEARDGPEAIECASRIQPHLALVDLGLPGFDGFEVARRLRSDPGAAAMTLVAVTGYGQIEDRRRSADRGFDAHMVKPVTMEQLNGILATAGRQRIAGVGSS